MLCIFHLHRNQKKGGTPSPRISSHKMSKIALFPSSGALGTSTAHYLQQFHQPNQLTFISRDPSKHSYASGVTTRTADYLDANSLTHAFDGAEYLVLISYPSIEHEARFQRHKTAIDAARASGVRHVFYSSLAFAGAEGEASKAYVMQAHLDTEKYLRQLSQEDDGFSFTSIREGIYSESFMMYIGFPDLKVSPDEVQIPHDGSGPGVAWAKRDELGEATARIVQRYVAKPGDEAFHNRIVLLSGSEAVSLRETARVFGQAAGGKDVKVRQDSAGEYAELPNVKEMLASHGPSDVPKQWATTFEAVREGETAVVTPHLKDLLGREPERFRDTIQKIYI